MTARIVLILATLAYTTSVSLAGTLPAPSPCTKALKACIQLSQVQDSQITQLKQDKDQLAKALAKANEPETVPVWAWITIGVLGSLVIGPVGALAVTVTGSQVVR